jgi:hypothetical protein
MTTIFRECGVPEADISLQDFKYAIIFPLTNHVLFRKYIVLVRLNLRQNGQAGLKKTNLVEIKSYI